MLYMSFLIGLLFICKGGDWFVDAASKISETLGIPKYVVGATIVSFATTMLLYFGSGRTVLFIAELLLDIYISSLN